MQCNLLDVGHVLGDVCPDLIYPYSAYFFAIYGTNFHLRSFVRLTYAFLALEHPTLTMEVNALCGLFCCIQGSICSPVPKYVKVMVIVRITYQTARVPCRCYKLRVL